MAKAPSQTSEQFDVAEGLLSCPTIGDSVTVLSTHSDPSDLESVSLATSPTQAEPLLNGLKRLPTPFWFLVTAILAATLGCSAKVEVERANIDEKAKTAIQLSLLQGRFQEAPAAPKPANSTTIINVGTGNVHVGEGPAQAQPARPKTGFNTAIGFPSTYTTHGPVAFLGYMAVCLLVGTAVVLMMATVGRKTGGPLLPILGLLVAAAIILQALPQAESGFQFIPQLPWHCSGLLSTLASIICWMALLSAVLIAVTGCLDAPGVFSGLVLAVMGVNLLVSLAGGSPGSEVTSVSSNSQVALFEKKAVVPVASTQTQSAKPVSTPKPPESPPSSPAKPAINISNNSFVFNYRAGDIHNETHIHIHEPPPKVQERIVIPRAVGTKPPHRPIEDPCERGQREHEERVRRWRQFPKGY